MRKSLTKEGRLRKKADLNYVFDKPDCRSSCYGAKLLARRNKLEHKRFAVLLTRKFGNAVERNYARRVLKEIYRGMQEEIPSGYDLVVILYSRVSQYTDRKQQFVRLIRGANFSENYS